MFRISLRLFEVKLILAPKNIKLYFTLILILNPYIINICNKWLGRRDGFQTFRLNKEVNDSDILSIKQILGLKEIKHDKYNIL